MFCLKAARKEVVEHYCSSYVQKPDCKLIKEKDRMWILLVGLHSRLHFICRHLNLKIIHRPLYLTCDRCNFSKGTLGRNVWFCSKIVPFWHLIDIVKCMNYRLNLMHWLLCLVALKLLLHCHIQYCTADLSVWYVNIKEDNSLEWKATSAPDGKKELVSEIQLQRVQSKPHGFQEHF